MDDVDYWGIISFITGSLMLCGLMLLCGYFLGGRSPVSKSKNVPFESGIVSVGDSRLRFSVKFCLIAIVFIIFDMEGIYLYIWSMSARDLGWIGLIEVLIFILVLLLGLVYLIRIGIFDWVKRSLKDMCYTDYTHFSVLEDSKQKSGDR